MSFEGAFLHNLFHRVPLLIRFDRTGRIGCIDRETKVIDGVISSVVVPMEDRSENDDGSEL